MNAKLQPCPFCGHAADFTVLDYDGGKKTYNIWCGEGESQGCGAVLFGELGESRRVLIAKWNHRPAPEEPTP